MERMLIIDDDRETCETIESLILRMGFDCAMTYTIKTGMEELGRQPYDVLFLDVRLPDGNGIESLPQIMSMPDPPEVIILTGKGDPDGAELAIQGGGMGLPPETVQCKGNSAHPEPGPDLQDRKKEKDRAGATRYQ